MTQRVAKKKLREARSNQKTTMVSEKLDEDSFGQERYSGCVWACLPSPLLGAAFLNLDRFSVFTGHLPPCLIMVNLEGDSEFITGI